MTDAATPARAEPHEAPIALDGLAYGVDLLDALLVLHLGDAHLYASWVREGSGVRAEDLTTTLRDLYRVGQFAARKLGGVATPRGAAPSPVLTMELDARTAVLRRVRAYAVVTVFDGAMPLGMVRLVSARLATALTPELPLTADAPEPPRPRPEVRIPAPRQAEEGAERAPPTLTFGAGLPRRSQPAPPRSPEADRARRLLAYLQAHAPEPHVVKVRLALRAGLTLGALESPEALGPEAMVLIETAAQDILGIDRAELRRIA
jgi:hypothetical protein